LISRVGRPASLHNNILQDHALLPAGKKAGFSAKKARGKQLGEGSLAPLCAQGDGFYGAQPTVQVQRVAGGGRGLGGKTWSVVLQI